MKKFGTKDRFDSITFSATKFLHENWRVSNAYSNFHAEHCGADVTSKHGHRQTIWFGVSKQPWKASGSGIVVDGTYIGQYE